MIANESTDCRPAIINVHKKLRRKISHTFILQLPWNVMFKLIAVNQWTI